MALQRSARKAPLPLQALPPPLQEAPAEQQPSAPPAPIAAKDPDEAAAGPPAPHTLSLEVKERAQEPGASPACAPAAPPPAAAAPEPIQLVLRIGRLTPPPEPVLLPLVY